MTPSDLRDISASQARALCRAHRLTGPTAGIATQHVQANLAVLPAPLADHFAAYCHKNPLPCPILERLPQGVPFTQHLARHADLRTDLPRYRVYHRDGTHVDVSDITAFWQPHHVAFLIGCSFTFEAALCQAGLVPRHLEEGRNVPMYRTNRHTTPHGPFAGPLVVSMRPIPRARLAEAYALTRPYAAAHGEPVHHGNPRALGITDLNQPHWGDSVSLRRNEVPVFWACGVTSQMALLTALSQGLADAVITHAPGHMFIGDLLHSEVLDSSPAPISRQHP